MSYPTIYGPKLTTVSGQPVLMGTGSGTKWQKIKKARPAEYINNLVDEMVDYLVSSIDNGFRHLDTAEIYTTEPEIGEAVRKTNVPREDLFIASKYNTGAPHQHAQYGSARESLEASLQKMGLEYLDMYLIHFPFFEKEYSNGQTIESVWADLVQAKKDGKVRYIGVSNFAEEHLKRCFAVAGDREFYPKVNQIEFHPYLQEQSPKILEFCRENDILVEAYGPLTPLFRLEGGNGPLKPVVDDLAQKYGKTDAQILLRYTLQKGILPITTSSQSQRQKEALDCYKFELEASDVELIDRVGSEFHYRAFFHNLYHTKD